MEQIEIINSLVNLGKELSNTKDEWHSTLEEAFYKNGWFTTENSRHALAHWSEILTRENIQAFLKPYKPATNSKNIGIVMAGNVPLVGLHDFICVILSGHRAVVKLSSDDEVLIKHLLLRLQSISPGIEDRWEIKDRLNNVDGVIATGSNNTARYFEYYFRNIPHLIRKSRTSVALIHPTVTDQDLQLLGEDVFRYFGLGCRNVGKLFLPTGFDPARILDNLMPYSFVLDHHKYANNYTYHRAIYLLNQTQHLDTGFLLFKEDQGLYSPLGTLFYEFYDSEINLIDKITEHKESIQCIIGSQDFWPNVVPFGLSQRPDLNDFADGVNTISFLENIS